MSEYTTADYKLEAIKLQKGLTGKRPIEYILKTYFPKLKGEKRRRMRMDIVNSLNGNSFAKTMEHKLMPIFREVYKVKTGKTFK